MRFIITTRKFKKLISVFLLNILLLNTVFVSRVFASPGGPTQPESIPSGGSKENVDLFTGDFKYSIPLFEMDGYPINMSYSSNIGVDEEASWVGLGWSLNPGAVNRIMRGVPDEFNGDLIKKEFYIKPNWTAGVNIAAEGQIANFEPLKFIKFGGSGIGMGMGVFYNSYNGLGTELSLGANLSIGAKLGGPLTGGVGVGKKFVSNSQKGVDITSTYGIYGGISKNEKHSLSIGVSGSSTFNNRTHLKQSFQGINVNAKLFSNSEENSKGLSLGGNIGGSKISSETPTYMPKFDNPMDISSFNFEAKVGGDVFVFNAGGSITGYFSEESVANRMTERMSYGYINYQNAKDNKNATLDLNREKDVPYHEQLPYLAIPNPTYDIFTVSNSMGGGTYRAHRTGSGILFDPQSTSNSSSDHVSAEVNFGNVFEGGFTVSNSLSKNSTNKWEKNNDYYKSNLVDFENPNKIDNTPLFEHSYFKNTSEITPLDQDFSKLTGDFEPVNIKLEGTGASVFSKPIFQNEKGNTFNISKSLHQDFSMERKNVRQSIFNPLTLAQRLEYGFDKNIYSRKMNDLVHFYNPTAPSVRFDGINLKNNPIYKSNHFSEIEIINTDGSKQIYGYPVYSVFSEDITFGTDNQSNSEYFEYGTENSSETSQSKDKYFNREIMPSYPTGWLISGYLAPNYVDTKMDGLTDDDLGNFVKFNYSKSEINYKWRLPVGEKIAKYNPGMISDPKDNKGSYSWGEREDWYMHSMETKTQVALFVLSKRDLKDANGNLINDKVSSDRPVIDQNGEFDYKLDQNGNKKYLNKFKLDKIVIYSKEDIKKNTVNGVLDESKLIPLKTIYFEYDYSLCNGVHGGKLTLKKMYFTYGNSSRSEKNKYVFTYNSNNPSSDPTHIDRWGKYKNPANNPAQLSNSEFPFTIQNKSITDANVNAWLLTKIDLPTGGSMEVNYESDDYSYVQNRKVQNLIQFCGIEKNELTTGIPSSNLLYEKNRFYVGNPSEGNHNYIYFKIDQNLNINSKEDVIYNYFNDEKIPNKNLSKIYFKSFVNLSNGKYEFVSGYAEIDEIGYYANGTQKYGWVKIKSISEEGSDVNSITHSSWRLMKNFMNTLTYPKSEIELSFTAPADIILSILGNIEDILFSGETFPEYAYKYQFAKEIDLSKSFIRLCIPGKVKYGGGARVTEIKVKDNWNQMANAPQSEYGQKYDYTTIENGKTISSGVAEYEPIIGNEDNPFRQAINFAGPKGLFDPNSFSNIELPIGESFYPSANVGYSKVKVTTIATANQLGKGTGYSVNDFYTAKDFPVITKNTNLANDKVKKFEPEDDISFFTQESKKHAIVSQGYAIELNDMHGKPKSNTVYNQKGGVINYSEYKYKTNDDGTLNNIVSVADNTETYKDMTIGVDYDFITDMREASTTVEGNDLAVGGGFFYLVFPIPWALPMPTYSYSEKIFKSAVTLKLIRRRGILESTTANQDGSIVKTENLIWDKESGNTILSKLNNEFKDPIYKLSMPAYWLYPGMGPTYKNINMKGTNSKQYLTNIYQSDLYRGFCHGIIKNNNLPQFNQINYNLPENTFNNFKLIKSGYQNLINLNSAEYLTLNNPKNQTSLFDNLKVLKESTSFYSDEWYNLNYNEKFNFYHRTLESDLNYSPKTNEINASKCTYLQTFENIIKYYNSNPGIDLPISDINISSILNPISDKLTSNGSVDNMYKKFRFSHSKGSNPVYSTSDFTIADDLSLIIGDIELRFFNFSPSSSFKLNQILNLSYNPSDFNCFYKESCVSCLKDIMYVELIKNKTPFDKLDKIICKNSFAVDFNANTSHYGKWNKIHDIEVENTNLNATDLRNGSNVFKSKPITSIQNDPDFSKSKMSINKKVENQRFNESLDIVDCNGEDIQYVIPKGEILNTQSPYYYYQGLTSKSNVNYISKKRFMNRPEVKIESKNARYEEILFYSFENDIEDKSSNFEYVIKNVTKDNISSSFAHTGVNSLKVVNNFNLYSKSLFNNKLQYFAETPLYVTNEHIYNVKMADISKYNRNSKFNMFFEPEYGKDYIASVWVKRDNLNPQFSINFKNDFDNIQFVSNISNGSPIIEGWQKLDIIFNIPKEKESSTPFVMNIDFNCPNSTCYFDDFRIIPVDAQSKSFVYDFVKLRKVAELDENHYSTLFDYDEEGKLIRTRKETEKGIMTINENRWSLKH